MDLLKSFRMSTLGNLEKHLVKLEESVRAASSSGEDISANYHGNWETKGAKLQERVRLDTRGILIGYIDATGGCSCGCGDKGGLDKDGNPPSLEILTPIDIMGHSTGLPEDSLNRMLVALQKSRELFGNHSYHHVIEGRIGFIVRREAGTGNRIPELFTKYRAFRFQPWTDPWTNYCCHLDLIEKGHPEMVPPEYRK